MQLFKYERATHMTVVGLPADEKSEALIVAVTSEATTRQIMDPWIQDRRYRGGRLLHLNMGQSARHEPTLWRRNGSHGECTEGKSLANGTIAIERRYLGSKYSE
jgi:hypothetical protein